MQEIQEKNTTFQNSTQFSSSSSDGASGEEFARSLALIINKCRVGRGFNKLEGTKLDDTIATWLEILLFNKIPGRALNIIYLLAQQSVSKAIENGSGEPAITVNYLVAAWSGGGRDEYYKRLNASKAQLSTSENPGEDCPRCLGNSSRQEFARDEQNGRILGLKKGFCTHDRLKPDEWLFKKYDGDPRDRKAENGSEGIF